MDQSIDLPIAWHTFATTVTLTNGVPFETVGQMLGNKNLRTTKHYARFTNAKLAEICNRSRLNTRDKL